jgi:hypothetical protein
LSKQGKSKPRSERKERAGKLVVPLPFDQAIEAALETEPPKQPKRKRRKRS